MKIFKFGGASVKDASGVKNLLKVIKRKADSNTIVIVSAMGKTTNALENIVSTYFNKKNNLNSGISELYDYHKIILENLFPDKHQIFNEINILFQRIKFFLENNKSPNHSFVYDQVVTYGEIISTTIINSFLNHNNIESVLLDARDCIKTDSNYRGGNVQWAETQKNILNKIQKGKINVTQGFIGSDKNNFSTSLGREGSDYSAAIFAYSLNGESLTIWKDVPGVLNGDPKVFNNSRLLDQISYSEAIELAFYGASVIHPKTLQPLQKKEIPLYVKSFLNPDGNGTIISKGLDLIPKVPCYIFKGNLILLKLSSLDFSFIVEDNISKIFKSLHEFKMKVDLIQNSAISFSVCIYDKYNRIDDLISKMEGKFDIKIYRNVCLYTIRYFDERSIKKISNGKKLLLEQRTEKTIQLIFPN